MVISLSGVEKRIRPLRKADLAILRRWDGDPELQQLTGRKFDSEEEMSRWWESIARDRSRLAVAIVDDLGRLIGDIELENVAWRAGEAELRIAIGDKSCWNQGYGTEALVEMARIAFEHLRLDSLYLRVSDQNVRAIRSYGKAGFRKVGRLRATGRLKGADSLVLMRMTPMTFVDHGVSESAVREGCISTAR